MKDNIVVGRSKELQLLLGCALRSAGWVRLVCEKAARAERAKRAFRDSGRRILEANLLAFQNMFSDEAGTSVKPGDNTTSGLLLKNEPTDEAGTSVKPGDNTTSGLLLKNVPTGSTSLKLRKAELMEFSIAVSSYFQFRKWSI
ncbi:uncharacterized protein LOC113239037 [Hyposmocoma kahamanoa]|uniref:uncharacterized protein LOC113239037 n=1 Tax=Hyposmocoma kahamanoa TaxID=1477025 RepID=UPI000E6D80B5|nr:uncharacterized protein LOC113239037 [Hyposmocoma kahamanoa]